MGPEKNPQEKQNKKNTWIWSRREGRCLTWDEGSTGWSCGPHQQAHVIIGMVIIIIIIVVIMIK